MNAHSRRLTVKQDALTLVSTTGADSVGNAISHLSSSDLGIDPRLVAAQAMLLLRRKRVAFDYLNEIEADIGAKQALSSIVLTTGEDIDSIFTVGGEMYRYFIALYNRTWLNERIVEVPIALDFFNKHRGNRQLEIGNVLSHYFTSSHDIVDKYEQFPGIINSDIIDYKPNDKYDTIVTLSTLEHIGHDKVRDDRKVIEVFRHIVENLLSDTGAFLFSIPIGFNTILDGYLDKGEIKPDEHFCLRRISVENDWVETSWNEAKQSKYMEPFHCANGMYFGIVYGKNHPAVKPPPPPEPHVEQPVVIAPSAPAGVSKGRVESNRWIRRHAAAVMGTVLSIGSRDDRDGEGGFYRNCFTRAASYTTSDVAGPVDRRGGPAIR